MTINNVRIFLEVYKSLNITAVSKKLHITQPVISRTIKNLEDEYDTLFFERLGKKLIPTESGRLFYQRMSKIITDIDTVREELGSRKEQVTIRIGAAIMIGNFLIPDICSSLKEKQPDINLRVTIAPASELKNKLLEDELDFALIEDNLHDPDLRYIPFYEDKMVPIFSPDNPLRNKKTITLKDLSSYPLLLREQGSDTRIYVDSLFSSKGIIIDPAWESTSTQAIVRGVERGLGISILPQKFVAEYLEDGRICTGKLKEKLQDRSCFIVYHKDKFLTPLYNSIFDFIENRYS